MVWELWFKKIAVKTNMDLLVLIQVSDEKVIRLCIQKLSFHLFIILLLKSYVCMCLIFMGCGMHIYVYS
jgi:hypothetical protein